MCDPFPYGGCVYCDAPDDNHEPVEADPDQWHDRQTEDDIEWETRR